MFARQTCFWGERYGIKGGLGQTESILALQTADLGIVSTLLQSTELRHPEGKQRSTEETVAKVLSKWYSLICSKGHRFNLWANFQAMLFISRSSLKYAIIHQVTGSTVFINAEIRFVQR